MSATDPQPTTRSSDPTIPSEPTSIRGWDAILSNRWAILGSLFLVTAALGLPLLWLSPVFTKAEKWFWSWIISLYTIVLIAFTALIVWWSFNRIAELIR